MQLRSGRSQRKHSARRGFATAADVEALVKY
jgi:hypothetical protein